MFIRDDRVLLESTHGTENSTRMFEAGSLTDVLACLEHEPPAPAELEFAIAGIEDALMPVIRSLPEHSSLSATGMHFREVAKAAGVSKTPDSRLDTAAVETLFNLLADVAYGLPATQAGIPTNRVFVAALLVLREVLHHGGFKSVVIT